MLSATSNRWQNFPARFCVFNYIDEDTKFRKCTRSVRVLYEITKYFHNTSQLFDWEKSAVYANRIRQKGASIPFSPSEIAQSDEKQRILRRCGTQRCRNFAWTIRSWSRFHLRLPDVRHARRLNSKTRSAALLPHFLRVLGERAVSPRETKERKRGANKERTMRTVDVRGAAKTANNGRGQWEEEQKGTERNRGGTQDAFKVVSTSVQPLCLALYLSRLWQSGKRRIRVLSSAYEIPRRSSRVYVKERAVSPSGWLLSIISPFFRLRDTRDRGQRPPFYPPVRPFRGTSSLTRATPGSGRTRLFVFRKLLASAVLRRKRVSATFA